MFKMPTEERINDIVDMVPEMISVFSNESKGYNARISKFGEMMRLRELSKELGVTAHLPVNLKEISYINAVIKANGIPNFALVKSKSGRFRLSFSKDGETPVVMLTRRFPDECIEGLIYVYSRYKVSNRDIKRMKASGAESYFNMRENFIGIL